MTLEETLLRKLADWTHAGKSRQTFAFLDKSTETAVELELDQLESLSCQLWELRVSRSDAAMAREPSLSVWADRVAERVTGLLEPLSLVEVDPERGQALLRSDKPVQKKDDRFYYEVVLNQTGSAQVRRYQGSRQPVKRQQVSFVVTREVLAKLVGDLTAN
jgi:hypothetical protein